MLPCPIVGAATSFFFIRRARSSSIGLIGSHDTRIIQLAGALLGTLFGFALGLALLRSAGDLIQPANSPAFLTAFVVAMFLFGYLAIPYVTIYPARRAAEKLTEVGAGEFALGVGAVLVGLIMGLLIGVPLAQLGGAAGSLLPPWSRSSSRR